MIDKKWSIALLLATIAVAGAFASGDKDEANDEAYGPRGGRGGADGRPEMRDSENFDRETRDADRQTEMEARHAEFLESADTYTGTFTIVDGEYPALIDADGEIWYLDARGFVSEETIPEEGAKIEVQAVTGGRSPDLLMVLEASIDGVVLEREPPAPREGHRSMSDGRGNSPGGMKGGRPGKPGGSGNNAWGTISDDN